MMGIGAGGWGQYAGASMYARYAGVQNKGEAGISPVTPVAKVDAVEQRQKVNKVVPDSMGRETAVDGKTADTGIPFLREGVDPVEMAVRGRIEYLDGKEKRLEGEYNRTIEGQEIPGVEKDGDESAILGLSEGEGDKDVENPLEELELPGTEDAGKADGTEKAKSPQEEMEEAECETCKNRKYQDGSDDPGVSFKTATNVAPEMAASAVRGHENEHVVRERAKAEQEDRKVVSQSVTMHTEICPECGDVYVSGGTTRTVTKADTSAEDMAEMAERQNEDANEKKMPLAS